MTEKIPYNSLSKFMNLPYKGHIHSYPGARAIG